MINHTTFAAKPMTNKLKTAHLSDKNILLSAKENTEEEILSTANEFK